MWRVVLRFSASPSAAAVRGPTGLSVAESSTMEAVCSHSCPLNLQPHRARATYNVQHMTHAHTACMQAHTQPNQTQLQKYMKKRTAVVGGEPETTMLNNILQVNSVTDIHTANVVEGAHPQEKAPGGSCCPAGLPQGSGRRRPQWRCLGAPESGR